jgi:hypothetical protein
VGEERANEFRIWQCTATGCCNGAIHGVAEEAAEKVASATSAAKSRRKQWLIAALKCVRENYLAGKQVEQNLGDPSPGGAKQDSPGRKSWVKWEIGWSPGGTAQVLSHTVKRCATQKREGKGALKREGQR